MAGVADGCRQAGCALVGGEMAEHPGAMEPGAFDLVGFAVGVAERERLVSGDRVGPGDVLIGLPSPGLRSNGYSLARHVFLGVAGRSLDDPAWDGAGLTLADVLLEPSVIYAPAVVALVARVDVHAVAHVTGGGIVGNVARVLPPGADAVVERGSFVVPPVFTELQRLGAVSDQEMERVFNLGVGMVVVVGAAAVSEAVDVLRGAGHQAVVIGAVTPGRGRVRIVH